MLFLSNLLNFQNFCHPSYASTWLFLNKILTSMIITNLFFPLSGVKKRPRANPAPSRENTIPHPRSRSVNIWLIYLQVLYSSHNPKHKIKLIYLQVLCSSHNPKYKIRFSRFSTLPIILNTTHKVNLIYLQVQKKKTHIHR